MPNNIPSVSGTDARREAILDQFEAAWHCGARPNLDDFLPADPADRGVVLIELAHTDLEIPGYEILGELGQGGMGVVSRARDVNLQRDVAIKILKDQFAAVAEAEARFLEEARIAGQLQPPGVPPVHQLGRLPDGRPFL